MLAIDTISRRKVSISSSLKDEVDITEGQVSPEQVGQKALAKPKNKSLKGAVTSYPRIWPNMQFFFSKGK